MGREEKERNIDKRDKDGQLLPACAPHGDRTWNQAYTLTGNQTGDLGVWDNAPTTEPHQTGLDEKAIN